MNGFLRRKNRLMILFRPLLSRLGNYDRSAYLALKDEVKEVEQIRKSIDSILRQEQREQQPRRTQDIKPIY